MTHHITASDPGTNTAGSHASSQHRKRAASQEPDDEDVGWPPGQVWILIDRSWAKLKRIVLRAIGPALWALNLAFLFSLWRQIGENYQANQTSLAVFADEVNRRLDNTAGSLIELKKEVDASAKTDNAINQKLMALGRADVSLEDQLDSLTTQLHRLWEEAKKQRKASGSRASGDQLAPASEAPTDAGFQKPAHSHVVRWDIPLVIGATLHTNLQGEADYWLVPRASMGVTALIKALPIETEERGVSIHSLDDGKDYVLTSSGGWIQ